MPVGNRYCPTTSFKFISARIIAAFVRGCLIPSALKRAVVTLPPQLAVARTASGNSRYRSSQRRKVSSMSDRCLVRSTPSTGACSPGYSESYAATSCAAVTVFIGVCLLENGKGRDVCIVLLGRLAVDGYFLVCGHS